MRRFEGEAFIRVRIEPFEAESNQDAGRMAVRKFWKEFDKSLPVEVELRRMV